MIGRPTRGKQNQTKKPWEIQREKEEEPGEVELPKEGVDSDDDSYEQRKKAEELR